MTRTRLAPVVRVAAYLIATAVAVLLLATISERRLAAYGSFGPLLLLIVALGGINATIAPLMHRVSGALGCLPFAAAALVGNGLLVAAAGLALPAVRILPLGVAVGALLVTVASGIVFSLWDEPTNGA